MKQLAYAKVLFTPNSSQLYTYKTSSEAKPGQLAVVQAPGGYKVVQIQEVLTAGEIKLNDSIDYKWIVQLIDLSEYEARKAEDISTTSSIQRL